MFKSKFHQWDNVLEVDFRDRDIVFVEERATAAAAATLAAAKLETHSADNGSASSTSQLPVIPATIAVSESNDNNAMQPKTRFKPQATQQVSNSYDDF